jgi:hypothetical protein
MHLGQCGSVDHLAFADNPVELQQVGGDGINFVVPQRFRCAERHRAPHIVEHRRRIGPKAADRLYRRLLPAQAADPADELVVGLAGTLLAVAAGAFRREPALAREELAVEPWMQEVGSPFVGYGQPSKFEDKTVRAATTAPGTTGTGASRTPLHRLNGTITPNGLHFERHHSGIPEIDPARHRLLVHGLVKRPLVFTLEALDRYPMESRIAFIECGGNSGALYQKDPAQLGVQARRRL